MAESTTEEGQQRPPTQAEQPGPPTGEGQPRPAAETQRDDSELISLLQRERADFANYRRRISQERAEDVDRARAQELIALLPLLDDLNRALTQVPDELADNPWTRGIVLSQGRLLDFLERSGVETIGVEGEPFDPSSHEALFYEERDGIDDRQVMTVVQPGYRLGGRVLRPAQVGVVGPREAASEGDGLVSEATKSQRQTDD